MGAIAEGVDAVLLDFDGTIVDSVALKSEAFRSIIEDVSPEQIAPCMNYFLEHGGVSRYEKFKFVWTEILHRPPDSAKIESLANEFHKRVFDLMLGCPYIAGGREFLEDYSGVVPLYVISGTPQKELDDIIEARRMRRYFRGVFGSPPPKPETARRILEKGNYSRERTWFVGDATTDRDAAREVGLQFVGVDGPHLTPYLDGRETVIPDLRELPRVLAFRK